MKKYILLLLALFIVGCSGQEDTEKITQLTEKVDSLAKENGALKGQVEELKKINTAVLEESTALVNELEKQIEELKSGNSRITTIENQIKDLKAKNAKKDSLIKDLKKQVTNLETSNKLLNGENSKLKDQAVRLKEAEKDLENIIEENRKFFKENPALSVEKKQELNRMEKQAKDAFDELDAEVEKMGW